MIARQLKTYLVIGFATLLLSACSNRQDAIDDLRTLVEDIRQNGNDYTAEQWADAEGIYETVCDDLEQYEYTQDEQTEISKLKGQYAAHLAKYKAQEGLGIVKDIFDRVQGAVEELKK